MNRRRQRFSPADSFLNENLEGRIALSAASVAHPAAEVSAAARSAQRVPTKTALTVVSGTLGQPTTFNVMVRGAAAKGAPQGTVNLVDHGKVIQTLTLSPSSTSGKYAYSTASYTLTPQPGGNASFFGKYSITAKYIPSGPFQKSSVTKNFNVAQPNYTTIANGVQIATIAQGSGPAIQTGQKANILYTGYLAKNGTMFDNSLSHGGSPFSFTLGTGQVIPGFDAGIVGMQAGESRLIQIPPSQGYGNVANGSIPANSTLVFIVTLKSIG